LSIVQPPMVDTVKYFRDGFITQINPPPFGWKEKSARRFSRTLSHVDTDLEVYGDSRGVWVEVSLPGLLFRNNAQLIVVQKDLEMALKKADNLLSQVAQHVNWRSGRRFTRVDIAWQVRGYIEDFISAHYQLYHPAKKGGKRLPIIYQRTGILWPGKECGLGFYDKLKQMKKGKGDIVRIEMRLRGKRLMTELGAGAPVRQLDLERCYGTLRKTVLGFSPKLVGHIRNKSDVNYWAIREQWKILGRPAIDVLLRRYTSEKRRKEAIKSVQREFLRVSKIKWDVLMPRKMPTLLFGNKHGCRFHIGRSIPIKFAKPKKPPASGQF
jgi:hypothetical protein